MTTATHIARGSHSQGVPQTPCLIAQGPPPQHMHHITRTQWPSGSYSSSLGSTLTTWGLLGLLGHGGTIRPLSASTPGRGRDSGTSVPMANWGPDGHPPQPSLPQGSGADLWGGAQTPTGKPREGVSMVIPCNPHGLPGTWASRVPAAAAERGRSWGEGHCTKVGEGPTPNPTLPDPS